MNFLKKLINPSSVKTKIIFIVEDNPAYAKTLEAFLKNKFTEIRILYKKGHDHESNELLLRLQPDEGISFSVWAKRPGYEHQVSKHALNFSFKD